MSFAKWELQLPFRVLGVPFALPWTLFLAVPLITWLIANRDLPDPLSHGSMPLLAGLVVAAGLWGAILFQEMSCVIAARLCGVKVRVIRLCLLGNGSEFDGALRDRMWTLLALLGPAVSFAAASVCGLVFWALPVDATAYRFLLEYLIYTNLLVGVVALII